MTIDRRIVKSRQQEKREIVAYGGTLNAGSGTGWSRRHDGRNEAWLIEFKRTDNRKQITIKETDLRSVATHALSEGRLPVLEFELNGRAYVVLCKDDHLERESLCESLSSND